MANLKSLAKDTVIYGFSSIVGRFLNYLLVPLYTQSLSAASGGYGVITNIYGYVALLLVILTFGMETTFFRFANKSEENPNTVYSTTLIAVGTVALAFVAAVLGFLPWIAPAMGYADHPSYIGVMAIVVALDAFQAIPFAYLRYKHKPIKFAALKLLFIVLNIILNLFYFLWLPALYKSYPDVIGKIYDPSVGAGYAFYLNLVCTGTITFFFWKELTGIKYVLDRKLLKRMLSYSWPLLVLGIAGILNQTADKILYPMIDKTPNGRVQLGIYGAACKIAMIMALITQAFRYAYEPFVFGKSSDKDNKETYATAMKYFIIFTLLAFLVVIAWLDVLKYFIACRLLGRPQGGAHCHGSRDYDGHLLQPVVLVQTHRQDHLGSLFLGNRLHGTDIDKHSAGAQDWIHGLCMGRFCRLWNIDDSELFLRAKVLSH